jgi:hypothetical protein
MGTSGAFSSGPLSGQQWRQLRLQRFVMARVTVLGGSRPVSVNRLTISDSMVATFSDLPILPIHLQIQRFQFFFATSSISVLTMPDH